MNTRLDKLHDQIMALEFDEAVCLSERFECETKTEVRERPMRIAEVKLTHLGAL